MKTAILIAMLLFGAIAVAPAIAADEQVIHAAHGKINAVSVEAGTVNITHDPIKSLKWPKMTMDFKARDPGLLKDLKPGAQVDFELMKSEGKYQIMKISPAVN